MNNIEESKINFGKRVKSLRIRNELTQNDLAQKLGVSKSIISAYEKGARTPSFETLIYLADILNVPVGIFFYEPSHKEENIQTVDVTGLTRSQVAVVETVVRSFKMDNEDN